jgi:imidazolonepropionase-like amidohydrolase
MTRWQRRLGFGLAAVAAVLLARAGCSLRPPQLSVPPERAAIVGVTIVNPGRGRRANQTLTIRDGIITAIRDTPTGTALPRDRFLERGYALPGLIDLDVRRLPGLPHLRRLFGIWFLAGGVTTVQVAGGPEPDLPAFQQEIAAGAFPWPRLVACGALLTGNGVACAGARPVRTAAEATAAVATRVAAGAPCAAVHRSVGPEALAALRAAAAPGGLRLIGDVPVGVAPADAGLASARLVSLVSPAPPARTTADWLRGWRDPGRRADAAGGGVTTGLQRWQWLAASASGTPSVPFADLLPRFYRDVVWPRQREASLSGGRGGLRAAEVAAAAAAMQDALRQRRAAGAPLTLGSSTPSAFVVPGNGLLLEMMALANMGLPLEEVWAAATRHAGEALGIAGLGTLEGGAPADLLIFRDDPTRDVAAFTTLQAVVARGRFYSTRALIGDMLEYARYAQRPLYDRLSVLAARIGLLDESGDPACDPL